MSAKKTTLTLINTNLLRNTFQNKRMRQWVVSRSKGKVLNLFCGPTPLGLDELRIDINPEVCPDVGMDALQFISTWKDYPFDTIILDPPYSYRKAMEMFAGNYTSKFKLIADKLSDILTPAGRVISFGYHSTFMGKTRGYLLEELCVFAHGGAQHCTIGIVESRE